MNCKKNDANKHSHTEPEKRFMQATRSEWSISLLAATPTPA